MADAVNVRHHANQHAKRHVQSAIRNAKTSNQVKGSGLSTAFYLRKIKEDSNCHSLFTSFI